MTEKENGRFSSRCYNKPTSRLQHPQHPGNIEANKTQNKIKKLFSSSGDEKENTPELIALKEGEQRN